MRKSKTGYQIVDNTRHACFVLDWYTLCKLDDIAYKFSVPRSSVIRWAISYAVNHTEIINKDHFIAIKNPTRVTIAISPMLEQKLNECRVKLSMSKSDVIRHAIAYYVKHYNQIHNDVKVKIEAGEKLW